MHHWKKAAGMATAVAAAGAIWAPKARAQSWETSGDLGAYLSVNFGRGPAHVGWGLEARAHRTEDACSSGSKFFGAVVRYDFRGNDSPRLLVGAQGGTILGSALTAANGELGVGYRFGGDPGIEAVAGAGLSGFFVGHAHADIDVLSARTSIAGGLRLPTFPPPGCFVIEGRPLRSEEGFAELPAIGLLGAPRADGNLKRAAASTWSRRAQTEWASVPTFLQLAEQLEILGAPQPLIARCLQAAADETRHALLSAGVVSQLFATQVLLDSVSMDSRPHAWGAFGLIRLATESWVDGCLGEGAAAACAAEEARRATDPLARYTQQVIAAEELRHAELAWDVLSWAVSAGGTRVRDALRATRDAQTPTADLVVNESEHDLAGYGFMGDWARREVLEGVRREAVQRLEALVGSV